ncbi:MAG: class I SAM-dependent RNA methyltransferase [Anaerotruncus sp.]|nr:class I SAM-dependent RNA methyltransferase [Anaerotruncus sp.]
MSEKIKLCCPCMFGLESVLSFEVKKLGGENVQATNGRVFFEGGLSMIAKANLWLRTAERVGVVMGEFRAESFTELFDQTAALPWERFIGREDRFPVKCASLSSKLFSVPDCQKIIKRAVVHRLEGIYHQRTFSETDALCRIQCLILKDNVLLLLDTSGAGLHKRGYRSNANAAPIKETLAAGIVDLARVRQDSVVLDPMCGSGTLMIEAALKALNIAPGIRRRFSAQSWSCFQNDIFHQVRSEAIAQVRKDAAFLAYASDIDPEAVRLTQENAVKAGVATRIKAKKAPLADFEANAGIVLTNPPYGERMLEVEQAEVLYHQMGERFQPAADLSYYIISPHESFEEFFGRTAKRRRKLYNGSIRCQLFMFFGEDESS